MGLTISGLLHLMQDSFFMCICMCMSMHAYVHLCFVEARGYYQETSSIVVYPFFFETGSLLNLDLVDCLDGWPVGPRKSPVSVSLVPGFHVCPRCLVFHGLWAIQRFSCLLSRSLRRVNGGISSPEPRPPFWLCRREAGFLPSPLLGSTAIPFGKVWRCQLYQTMSRGNAGYSRDSS